MLARTILAAALCALLLQLGGCKHDKKPRDAAPRPDVRKEPKPPPPDLLRSAKHVFIAGDKHQRLRKLVDGDSKTSYCFATAKRTERVWLWLPAGSLVEQLELTFAGGTKSPHIEGGKLKLVRSGLTVAEHTIGAKRADKGVRVKLAAPAKGGAIFTLYVDKMTGCVGRLALRGKLPAALRRSATKTPTALEGELPKLVCPTGAEVKAPRVDKGDVQLACLDDKQRGHGPFVRWSLSDGFLRERGARAHGKRDGRTRVYKAGNLVVEGSYDHGTKQGLWRRSNDRLHIEERFDENGQRVTMGPPPTSVHPALAVAKIPRKKLLVHARLRLQGASDVLYLVRDNAPEAALRRRRPRSKTGRFYIVGQRRALPLFKQRWKVVHKTDLVPAHTVPRVTAEPLDTDGHEAIVVRLSYKALGKDAPEFIIALPCVNLLGRVAQDDKVKITGRDAARQVEIEHAASADDKSVRPVPIPTRDACPLTAPPSSSPGDGGAADGGGDGGDPRDGGVKPVKATTPSRRRRRRRRRHRGPRRRRRHRRRGK